MGSINSTKKYNGFINNNKNNLNSKISWFFNLDPNTHYVIHIFGIKCMACLWIDGRKITCERYRVYLDTVFYAEILKIYC